jgi:hypothetical protein
MDLALTDVQLELPRLTLESQPQFFPDNRIRPFPPGGAAGAVPPGPPPFTYHFRVVTPDGHPVRLLSNLARAPVPVGIDLQGGSSVPLRGSIRVADFPVNLFRRDATVEHLNLTLAPERSPIDGVIRIVYTDYTMRILLSGTAEKPWVHLVSDPPLPENQLIAVLLFGRPIDELDPDQAISAGHARDALADGAINLVSLYLLAATPIESIGYDPGTGVFSAKVRLASGTSLNVGAGPGELQSVGISKRISRRWRITTELTRPDAAGVGGGLSALLEWSNRY